MITRNRNQIVGTRFEKWLELILTLQSNRTGKFKNIRRNVILRKKNGTHRQADIYYMWASNGTKYNIILEAKYSSNGPINYDLREGEKHKNGQVIPVINNVVDELYERKKFIGADYAFLVTNKSFHKKIIQNAKKMSINLMDGKDLEELYYKVGLRGSFQESIDYTILINKDFKPKYADL